MLGTSLLATSLLLAQTYLIPHNPRAAAEACTVPDETSYFTAVWLLEESTGTGRASHSSAACVSDCELDDKASVEQSSTHVEGTYAAHFTASDSDELDCAFNGPNCDELDFAGDATVGFWGRKDDDTTGNTVWDSFNANDGMQIRGISTRWDCKVGDSADNQTAAGGTNADENIWYHVTCVADATNDYIYLYVDGELDGSQPQQDMTSGGPSSLEIGHDGGLYANVTIDEMFAVGEALSADEICHICSCGISNWRGCTATGASPSGYDDTGVNASLCGSCTLPSNACNPIQ